LVAISLLGSRVRSCLAAIYFIEPPPPNRLGIDDNEIMSTVRALSNINHEAQRRTLWRWRSDA
jgi:hypothetical protein